MHDCHRAKLMVSAMFWYRLGVPVFYAMSFLEDKLCIAMEKIILSKIINIKT